MTPYYQDDAVTIYHGDALEILPHLGTSTVAACITDPPYVIGAVSAGTMASKSGGWADMMNSALWFTVWYREVSRVLRTADGCFWTFLNWRTIPVVMRAALDAGLPVTSMLVWDKEWIGPGGPQGLRPSYELVALMAHPEFQIPDRGIPDIWRCQVGSYKASGHPAEKPEPLVRRIIESSAVDGIVLDPFLGSGTTAVAAKNAGRHCIGIEAEERYCELAATRCAQEVLDLGTAA
jgi:DNA modification methylase